VEETHPPALAELVLALKVDLNLVILASAALSGLVNPPVPGPAALPVLRTRRVVGGLLTRAAAAAGTRIVSLSLQSLARRVRGRRRAVGGRVGKVVIVRATGRVEGTAKGGIVKGGRVVVGAGVGVEVFWGGWDGIWWVGGIEKGGLGCGIRICGSGSTKA